MIWDDQKSYINAKQWTPVLPVRQSMRVKKFPLNYFTN